MMRYAAEISYDGGAFGGWQSQSDGRGIQDYVERALHALGERTRVQGAGRTDAGVHARGQVASFLLSSEWDPKRLKLAINSKLPETISVMRTASVPGDFHARKSAISREYRYFIWNASSCYPHIRSCVLWRPGAGYDWSKAASAARLMAGEHDFRAFCRKEDCPESTRRSITRVSLVKHGRLVVFRVEANAFLTNMVRIMVGNLLDIARGRRDEAWLLDLLRGEKDRTASGKTANPSGLFFWKARYPFLIPWQ